MGIFKRGKNWWIDFYVNGIRKRKKIGTNKRQAEIILGKIKSSIVEGKYLDVQKNEKIRLVEMLNYFLEGYSKVSNKPSTYYRNTKIAKNLIRYLGNKYLYEINALDIDNYKKKRIEEKVKPTTINRELALLKAVLNKAKQWGKIKTPIPEITLFKIDNKRIRFLKKEEAEKLINFCSEPLKSIVILALHTGMRRCEILNLQWKDVDFKERLIILHDTKNRETRYIPLNQVAYDVLLNIPKDKNSDYIFPGKNHSVHLDESYVSHKFKNIVKKLGIRDFKFHDLRHTFASWLVMNGINLKTVQELLGHKTYAMTLRYAHLSPEHRKQAVEILSDRYGKIVEKNTPKMQKVDTIWTPKRNKQKEKLSKL